MNTQKQIEALETKLAEVSAELQRLKGRKAGQWVPQIDERCLVVGLARGRIFPDTPEGREAAEWFAFCEGFRARWKRSADRGPDEIGFLPIVEPGADSVNVATWNNLFCPPKWSTESACRAFVDSEGGPEKFAEILKRGVL